jgi:thymidylate synthase (FAD)
MQVELLHNTPLWVASKAIRKCWASEAKSDNGGTKDKELIERIGNKNKQVNT